MHQCLYSTNDNTINIWHSQHFDKPLQNYCFDKESTEPIDRMANPEADAKLRYQ